jgi:hypothetical protein
MTPIDRFMNSFYSLYFIYLVCVCVCVYEFFIFHLFSVCVCVCVHLYHGIGLDVRGYFARVLSFHSVGSRGDLWFSDLATVALPP